MNKLNQGPRVKIGSRIGNSTLQGVEEQDLCPLPKIRIHMANHLTFFFVYNWEGVNREHL